MINMEEQLTLNILEIEEGAIVRNRNAKKYNPFRFFIYQSEADGVVNGLGLFKEDLIEMQCRSRDPDGRDMIEVLGQSEYKENYKRDLKEWKNGRKVLCKNK